MWTKLVLLAGLGAGALGLETEAAPKPPVKIEGKGTVVQLKGVLGDAITGDGSRLALPLEPPYHLWVVGELGELQKYALEIGDNPDLEKQIGKLLLRSVIVTGTLYAPGLRPGRIVVRDLKADTRVELTGKLTRSVPANKAADAGVLVRLGQEWQLEVESAAFCVPFTKTYVLRFTSRTQVRQAEKWLGKTVKVHGNLKDGVVTVSSLTLAGGR
jgi:hypothetical protein